MLTFEEIRKNPEIKTYIERSNEVLGAVGFTEHGFPHALRTSDIASRILRELGYDARTCELAQIAAICTILEISSTAITMRRTAHASPSRFFPALLFAG